jgi:hypothetical protein
MERGAAKRIKLRVCVIGPAVHPVIAPLDRATQ